MNTFGQRIASDIDKLRQELVGGIAKVDALGAALSGVWPESLPCSAWDSRCSQYEILLRRASFLMQIASKHDPDMVKFIDEVERLLCSSAQNEGDK